MSVEELHAANGSVRLTGSLWRPPVQRALVLMFPGSGPSDRDNDVLFPPIRAALLDAGAAVCSFDKRGVGRSSGSWLDADIPAQASDLLASLAVAREAVPGVPVGLFGHSQGGWVVLEAANAADADFVITNSGPAVTPREQEMYSAACRLRDLGWDDLATRVGLNTLATVMDSLIEPFELVWPRIQALPMLPELLTAGVFIPEQGDLWAFAASIINYDPRAVLEGLHAPLLALLGAKDPIVPIERSAEVFRAAVPPELLELRIVADADHRFQASAGFVTGYLDTITTFVTAQLG